MSRRGTAGGASNTRIAEAVRLMMEFAERTGLTSERSQQRYLWTDAFAVCNFLGIARATGDQRYAELALRSVERVHHTLGKHRADDGRTGWISGLSEQAGESHPTRGGLRIGKRLPERRADEPFDDRLEWDRDGQYFHYLTKWMHALDQVSRSTSQPHFNLWARELAETAYVAFSAPQRSGRRRLVWKMSVDLSRALVPSMGQHDPLDGFITYVQLRATASMSQGGSAGPDLRQELVGFASMIEGADWVTADPLGIGGLLIDAFRVQQLFEDGAFTKRDLLHSLLAAALAGLRHYARQEDLRQAASRRLAFRELGLSIGLHAVELMQSRGPFIASVGPQAWSRWMDARFTTELRTLLEALGSFASLGSTIESFWLDCEHQQARTWSSHRDINEVTLATSLVPEGFLILSPAL